MPGNVPVAAARPPRDPVENARLMHQRLLASILVLLATGAAGCGGPQTIDNGLWEITFQDFVIFKTLFDAANGAGAFVTMLAAVPEPTSVVLVLTAGLFSLPLRQRVKQLTME